MHRLLGIYKRKRNKRVIACKELFIGVPDGLCFSTVAKQLEHPAEWDLLIFHVWPVSGSRLQEGATSYVFFNLLGKTIHALATIYRYRPKNTISWTLSGNPKVWVCWRLKPKDNGTFVRVTLAWQTHGWLADFSLYQTLQRKKVERLLTKMLFRLKKTIESDELCWSPKLGNLS